MLKVKYRLDDFELYKLARKFRQKVFKLIKQLPPEERYCLNPQMRKTIVSVTNNIAEGHGRWHYLENIPRWIGVGFQGVQSQRFLTILTFVWTKDMEKKGMTKNSRRTVIFS
ncbi:four helix bundle protein [candidate division KSB1 bacterium]|nr:four helix bundle protein [candidate division KSB1 bacterium]